MVIQAHLGRKRQSRNNARDARKKLRLQSLGRKAGGQSGEVLIHDLSTSGLLLQTDGPLEVGEIIEVELPRTGVRDVEVIWSSGSFYGCRFLQPLSPAAVSAAVLRSTPDHAASSEPIGDRNGPIDFGARLAELRREQDWSLDHLAERLGVSRQAVWYWETGQRLPRAGHFAQIAEVFGVKEADLLGGAVQSPPRDRLNLIADLRRELARLNGVQEDKVKITVEY